MHDAYTIGIPLLAIFAGIFLNNKQLDKLETRLDSRFDRIDRRFDLLEGRMDKMQSDLSQFYMILGKHDARLDSLERK